jgi:hypothetical protein
MAKPNQALTGFSLSYSVCVSKRLAVWAYPCLCLMIYIWLQENVSQDEVKQNIILIDRFQVSTPTRAFLQFLSTIS